MLRYIVYRLTSAVPVVLLVTLISFLLMQFIPGDAAGILLGLEATPAELERMRSLLGVDRPILVQLVEWYRDLARGDLGFSLLTREDVVTSYLRSLPVTVALSVYAFLLTLLIGIPAGILAAIKKNTAVDQAVMTMAVLGVSLPNFWLALMLILLFAVELRWLPSGGYVPFAQDPGAWLRCLTLPAASLALLQIGLLARIARSSMLEVLRQDYIRTARAKGVSRRLVIGKHALKNVMIPVTTVLGLSVAALLSGSVVIETVYSLPGVGRLLVGAVQGRDYPVIQGGLLLTAVLLVGINLLVDILYTVFDPRVRYGQGGGR